MKLKLTTILFLVIASISMAQKKEMRKIEKAIASNKFSKAVEIFNTIDESTVEQKYLGQYSFYKAATTVGISGISTASTEKVYESLDLIKKSKELGYDNNGLLKLVKSKAMSRLFAIANEELKSNNTKGALEIVNYISDSNPDDMLMVFNAANLAYQAEEFDEAKVKYQSLLDKKFTGQDATYTAFNIAKKVQEDFPNKELRDVSVRTGSHNNPQIINSPSRLGRLVTSLVWMYKNDGEIDKAKNIFEKALLDFPNDESLKIAKADNYLTLGMMDEYKSATESLTKEIKDPKVYDNLAIAALNVKDYDQAMKYYELSVGIEPNNFIAQANLGLTYVEKGNLEATSAKDQLILYKEAIVRYEKAHAIKPEDKTAINTLISLYGVFEMTDKVTEMKAKL